MSNFENETKAQIPAEDGEVSESRRSALAKMGLYAAYTAPIMLGMMTASKAQTASVTDNFPGTEPR